MGDRIEILTERLIDEHPQLALEVLAASARLGRPLGWHYVLDLIWVLHRLELPAGSTVLDAGAGWGVLQFMLADRGYRVISADMATRRTPKNLEGLYNFSFCGSDDYIDHPYLKRQAVRGAASTGAAPRGDSAPHESRPSLDAEGAPTLLLYRCELTELRALDTSSVDAVVSVSALEHNPPEQAAAAARELERVAKPGAPLLLTLSACEESQRYHEPSQSFLLDGAGLAGVYGLRDAASDLDDYSQALRELQQPRYLDRWLSHCYGAGDVQNGMPRRVWAPEYLPVALHKTVVKSTHA